MEIIKTNFNIESPLVSVIIPTYNRKELVARAVNSVFEQTYKNIEIIVIDDASDDDTFEVIRELSKKDARMFILRNETNLGLAITLNKAIQFSHGEYIARLDDDDFWCNIKKLEKQVDFLEKNKEYALVGGGAVKINKEGKQILRYLLPEHDEDIREKILIDGVFAHVTVLFRKSVFEESGGYDENLNGFEDWDLWLKLGKFGKLYNFQEYFTTYSGHQKNNLGYLDKKNNRKEKLDISIALKKRYKNYYPGYKKAILSCWISYFYSFLPFLQRFYPLLVKVKMFFLNNYYIKIPKKNEF
ncbi:MAG: hypothetical protein A2908_01625 [Candidatus Staskawiczbacteria bacterium RIFCSPLOWO2_01_FULL_38_12b]|uniref:Glycosyltransferase 2-like domain-containing protein n=1 Tax=Candidatus Staskawiczbacteria bacterium RIFCSPLOWO2_01_FULL_38_12b TaxID=1802214 RepID=A0A1G2ICS6_9BACT|nr:MAG: hypothetical protein A2908_01625 [Candidatus Staskawiczbacteria bacterium RIFCSPLOWO2_01_FULL_38_12b]